MIDIYHLPHNKLNMYIILQGFNQNELTIVKHQINDAIQNYDTMLGIHPSAFRYIITMNKWFEPQDNKYGNTSTPYIYYNDNIVNIEVNSILYLNGVYYTNTIRHEIAHVLLTYSLDNLYLRPLFDEGIARLVEHNGKGKHELAKILFDDVYKNYSTNDILSINKDFHTIGSAIIHYLYNLYPETIKNFIYCIRKHINELECVEAYITKYFNMYNFKSWLFHKNNIHDIADTSKDTVPDYKNIPIESQTSLHNTKKLSTEDSIDMLKDNSRVNSDTTLKPTHDPNTIVFVYDATAKQYFVYNCTDKDLNQFEAQSQDSTDIYNKLKHYEHLQSENLPEDAKVIIYHKKSKILYDNFHVELYDYNNGEHYSMTDPKAVKETTLIYENIYRNINNPSATSWFDWDHNFIVGTIKKSYDML